VNGIHEVSGSIPLGSTTFRHAFCCGLGQSAMERAVYASMAALQSKHWWFRARRAILTDQIARLPLAPDARVLEAGCGPGGNLAMLSAFGSLCAFDFDAESVAQARSAGHATIKLGALPDAVPFEGPFDLIAALDVVEHLDHDVASVRALVRRLAIGGHLVITVPAFQMLWSAHDVAHHHKRRYRRSQLRALVAASGCTVVKSSYFNCHLFPLIAAVRLAQKLLGLGARAEDAMPGPRLNRLLQWIFSAERFALRRFNYPFGVSLLIIARRTQ
jgi:SAM-dependent methyltransferase